MVRPAAIGHPRVVLDTNVFLRALLNIDSPSGKILKACEIRILIPLLSKPVVEEYLATVRYPDIVDRYPHLELETAKLAVERLIYIGDLVRKTKPFAFPRDPRDAKFIELAIAGRATHLVTLDNDLLDLPHGHDEASRRFRRRLATITVVEPVTFIGQLDKESNPF